MRKENCNDANFLNYVRQSLAPRLMAGTTVIWDRLGRSGRSRNPGRIHYNPDAIVAVRGRRCSVVFLPPKGKYLNPIEEAFKTLLAGIARAYYGSDARRQQRPRTLAELQTAATAVAASFTPAHYRTWFDHRGDMAAFTEAYPNNQI